MNVRVFLRFIAVSCLAFAMKADAEGAGHYFYPFNKADGCEAGEPPKSADGFQVLQGTAVVSAPEGSSDGQFLSLKAGSPFAAVALLGKRPVSKGRTHLEIWVRPCATAADKGEEFLDFDGAAIGFFTSKEDGHAEINVLHTSPQKDGIWLSTGQVLELNEAGQAVDWFRIGIAMDWPTRTWEIEVNGKKVLQGIGFPTEALGQLFQLRLYGQESGDDEFDDILISGVPPDELAPMLEARALALKGARQSNSKGRGSVVTGAQTAENRRQSQTTKPDATVHAKIASFEMEAKVTGGGKHLTTAEYKDDDGVSQRLRLYSPGYDSSGKPLPLEVTIRCDAKLEVGATLADIKWAVTEQKNPKEVRELTVIKHGKFSTGPVQIVTMPTEWSNKALVVHVGELQLTKRPTK